MRRIIAAVFVSLDGVMQGPGGPEEDRSGGFAHGGWTVPFWGSDAFLDGAMEELFSKPFDLLLGRRTYDIFAAHWPHLPDDPIGALFNRITKYVATHRPDSLAWANSEWLGEDPAARLAALKAGDGPDLLVQGSSDFLRTLLAADLVDEFRLLIFPVVLGGGKRLFSDGAPPRALRLERSQASANGVTLAIYRPAGPVATGSFQLPDPSPEEIARRRGNA